jgi:hypothetical protein
MVIGDEHTVYVGDYKLNTLAHCGDAGRDQELYSLINQVCLFRDAHTSTPKLH